VLRFFLSVKYWFNYNEYCALCLQGNKISTAGGTRILWVGGDYGPSTAIQFQNNRIVTSKVASFIHVFLTLPP
jgi:hypothetical protein